MAQAIGLNVHDEGSFSIEDFTTHLQSKYTLTENILRDETLRKKMVGRVLGSLGTKAAQTFGLTNKEVDGKDLEEIFATVKGNQLKALELAGAGNQDAEARLKELSGQLAEKEGSLQALTARQTELQEQHQLQLQQWEQKLKSHKLNDKVTKALNGIADKLTDEFHKSKLVRTGFDTHFDNTYELDLNETDEVLVKLRATGEVVKSKTAADKPATLDELYLTEAEAKGILKKNNGGIQKPVLKSKHATGAASGDVKIHPNAQKRTQLN